MILNVRFFFTGLPIEELRMYRRLRQELGIDRRTANFILYGRLTVHNHGRAEVIALNEDGEELARG